MIGTRNCWLTGYDGQDIEFSVPAVSGSRGKHRLPDGDYSGSKLRPRIDKAMSCPDGSGWSLNLDPLFKTDRDLLRIHPDGNLPGTLGCIAPACGEDQKTVHDRMKDYFDKGNKSIPVKVEYPK